MAILDLFPGANQYHSFGSYFGAPYQSFVLPKAYVTIVLQTSIKPRTSFRLKNPNKIIMYRMVKACIKATRAAQKILIAIVTEPYEIPQLVWE